MNQKDKALEYFRNEFNCSQAVFTVFGVEAGLSEDISLRISCPFGGGIGRTQGMCGAVSGALMALGLSHGKGKNDPEAKKKITYEYTREFITRFRNLNGSLICLELLDGLSMNDPEELQKIKELKLFDIKCEKFVADAVSIVSEINASGI
jgi:C_GCAxxG_C_C family probable redox protein